MISDCNWEISSEHSPDYDLAAAPSYHTMKPSYTDAGVSRTTGKMSGHMPTISEEKERCKTLPTKAGSVGQGAARRMAAATAPVTSTARKMPQPIQVWSSTGFYPARGLQSRIIKQVSVSQTHNFRSVSVITMSWDLLS